LVSGGAGGTSNILAFSGDDRSQLEDVLAFDSAFRGGVFVGGL